MKSNDRIEKLCSFLTEEEKDIMHSIKWLHLFSYNGWEWINIGEDGYDEFFNYEMKFLSSMYDCTITAFVSENFYGIDSVGDIGIAWLECTYEYERKRYDYCDLKDMIGGIIRAEVNLVKLGVPFKADYTFHQLSKKDNYNLKRANLKNRKKLKCDDVVNIWDIVCERVENNGRAN